MDISLESIISIAGLLFGGGGIGMLITWRYQKKKAKAEAKQAEAEAEKAKFEAMQANAQLTKEIQELTADLKANLDTQQQYNEEQKQYIKELKEDRQHLRQERDDLRKRQDKLEKAMRDLQFEVARNSRMVAFMRPFLCGRDGCAIRVPVAMPAEDTADVKNEPAEIEPYNEEG